MIASLKEEIKKLKKGPEFAREEEFKKLQRAHKRLKQENKEEKGS